MSAEAMSGGSAMGMATPVGSASSLGGELGGTYQPGFSNNVLSQAFEIPTPSLQIPEGGKAILDASPFENTQVLWQASTTPSNTTPIDIDFDSILSQIQEAKPIESELSIPEIKSDAQPEYAPNPEFSIGSIVEESLNDSLIADIDTVEPEIFSAQQSEATISGLNIQPEPSSNLVIRTNDFVEELLDEKLGSEVLVTEQGLNASLELIADAQQAAKVEDALVAIGTPKEEAHETALNMLKQTQQENGFQDILKKKTDFQTSADARKNTVFEHDEKVDAERKKVATAALDKAIEKAIADGKSIITGYDLASVMPTSPQPTQVKSGIVEDGTDGSYDYFINYIRHISEINSVGEAEQVIQSAISNNHAVKLTDNPTSEEATKAEVSKVLKTSGIIFKK